MLSLYDICASLQGSQPNLGHTLSIPTIIQFIRVTYALKEAIIHEQLPSFDPAHIPSHLLERIQSFLARKLLFLRDTIHALWTALCAIIWTQAGELCSITEDPAALGAGEDYFADFQLSM